MSPPPRWNGRNATFNQEAHQSGAESEIKAPNLLTWWLRQSPRRFRKNTQKKIQVQPLRSGYQTTGSGW